MTINTYQQQALRFLGEHDLKLTIRRAGTHCPPWQKNGHCVHGDAYQITIARGIRPCPRCHLAIDAPWSISFPFWNSLNDIQTGKKPTAYDILACISSDAQGPTNSDAVHEEFGDMKPSDAMRIAKFAKRLQKFFTLNEIDSLVEIQ